MAMLGRRGFARAAGAGLAAAAAIGAGRRAMADGPFEVQTQRYRVRVSPLVAGLSHPWGLDFLPAGGGLLITERDGRLRLFRNGSLATVGGLPAIVVGGQGGLLDVALHPGFASNRLVYLTYAGGVRGATFTALARARLGTSGQLEGLQVLFEGRPAANSLGHYGSRIAFDGRGYVFVSVGERMEMERAQRLGEYNGKIVRLFDDGRIPADNPFVGRPGALPGIWALGIRSPQGLAFQPGTGRLFECEHGPLGGDEINIIQRGRNYGWPIITWGRNYDGTPIGVGPRRAGLEQPIKYWTPSIAPSGISFYNGSLFPAWRGNLFVAALKFRLLVRLELVGGVWVTREERFLQDAIGRIRHVKPGPDGRLYLLTDEADGGVWTVEPAA